MCVRPGGRFCPTLQLLIVHSFQGYPFVSVSSKFNIIFATADHAASSTTSSFGFLGDSPTARNFSAPARSLANLVNWLESAPDRISTSEDFGGRAVATVNAHAIRCRASAEGASVIILSANFRADSTYVGSFINIKAWSGV